MKKALLFFALILLLFGCKKDAPLSSETFDLSYFNNVEINNSFEVELVEGPEFKIEISSKNANNIDKVDYEIINDELIIADKRKLKFLNPNQHIYIKIHAPEFFRFTLRGGVTLTNRGSLSSTEIGVLFKKDYNFCDLTLNNDGFYFWNELESGGEIKLKGNTNIVKFWFSGLVNIDARSILSNEVLIYSNSRIDSEVYASQKIDCEIVGGGNVYVSGSPSIVFDNSPISQSSGKLIMRN